jgi:hypothetical protein
MRRFAFGTLAVVLATALCAVAAPARAAVEVPAGTIWTMAGTPDGSRIFAGALERGLLAVDAGGTVTRVEGLGRVVGIRMGADGRTLWVGLPNDQQIAAVDAVTLTVRARYDVGVGVCPGDVAETGRFVTFGFSCFIYSDLSLPTTATGLGVLDTATGAVRTTETGVGYQPIVATSPGLPNRVFVTDYWVVDVWLEAFDVSTGTPERVAGRRLGPTNVYDLAVAPDGSEVAVSAGDVRTFTTPI